MDETTIRSLASWTDRRNDVSQIEHNVREAYLTYTALKEELQRKKDLLKQDFPKNMMSKAEYHLWSRVNIIDDENSCWEFTGSRRSNPKENYGQMTIADPETGKRITFGTHRLAFLTVNGFLPEVVRHTCDNPPCCRPSHLLKGTHQENAQDRVDRGRTAKEIPSRQGEKNSRSVLTDNQVLEIRRLVREDGLTHGELAKRYGVERYTITTAVSGITYKHLNNIEPPIKRRGGTRLTEEDVRTMRALWEAGTPQKEIAERYDVTVPNVSNIVNYKTWKHVTPSSVSQPE